MRGVVGRPPVGMHHHAEAVARVDMDGLGSGWLVGAEMGGDEIGVDQQLLEVARDALAPRRSGIPVERGARVGAELFQRIGHCPSSPDAVSSPGRFRRRPI